MPIGSVSVGTVFLHPSVFPTPQAQLWKGEKKNAGCCHKFLFVAFHATLRAFTKE